MGMLLHRHMLSLERRKGSEVIQSEDIEPEITVDDVEEVEDETTEKQKRGRKKE